MSISEGTQPPWHTVELTALHARLQANEQGLTAEVAAARLSRYGPTRLPEQPPLASGSHQSAKDPNREPVITH